MQDLFNEIYKNKTVLVTGHTGFKGSWLSFWLNQMGANVIGYSLQPSTTPNHFELLNLDMVSIIGDIRDIENLNQVFQTYKPDIVFHLAAQPLVRYSYSYPIETYETNVMGVVNLFECCKKSSSVKAVLNVTTDKCYENREWIWGYKESDPMGGYDPYSASKACSELITSSYRNSFFNLNEYQKSHQILVATARAGNVIGGGDWSIDRLIPDIIKATVKSEKVIIRNPNSTRPWQHVLEAIYGYLLLGEKLLNGEKEFADAFNFGPNDDDMLKVIDILKMSKECWSSIDFEIINSNTLHEASLLKLDSTKARLKLQWKPKWNSKIAIEQSIDWYRNFYENGEVFTSKQLKDYIEQI
ncbi:MAG: CDP-glucose 4,6-dehydratase [Campylobacterales bacterium]|nr:CDP-glucose 4,6-dehydratase [Campylobacterales bacterium]